MNILSQFSLFGFPFLPYLFPKLQEKNYASHFWHPKGQTHVLIGYFVVFIPLISLFLLILLPPISTHSNLVSIHLYFIFKNIYLFIWLRWVLVVACQLLSCGMQPPQLWHVNSQLWHACGIQFPDQRSNPGPLHWECGVLSTVPPGKSLIYVFRSFYIFGKYIVFSVYSL